MEKEKNAMQRLNALILEKNSRICAGLDPDWDEILKLKKCENSFFQPEVLAKYCTDYINSIYDIVPATNINIGFFERVKCFDLYFEVAAYAKEKGLFVIGDINRGGMGSTSAAYAEAFLGEDSPFDAITINPYLGTDGVMPFLKLAKENGKGVFVLVKTHNKSSKDIQDLKLEDGRYVYEAVADLVLKWEKEVDPESFNKLSNLHDYPMVGAVVGTTCREETGMLVYRIADTFCLVPEYDVTVRLFRRSVRWTMCIISRK